MGPDRQLGALAYSRWFFVAKHEENQTLENRLSGLFEELRVPLFRYLIVILGGTWEAEDVTQECFLRLFLELRSGKQIGNIRSWLFRVGHNLAIDRWRESPPEYGLDAAAFNVADDRQPASDEALIRREQHSVMQAAIGRLSRQQRLCLHLRTESFRYREIAEILGVSESTVCENIRRGLSRLMRECHDA